MDHHRTQLIMGIAASAVSIFLIFVAIPFWVAAPSNVPKIILSPLFWPYVLSGVMLVTGMSMIALAWRERGRTTAIKPSEDTPQEKVEGGYFRLAIMIVVMTAYVAALPWLGMVWTSMLVFVAVAFLVRTSHPKTAILSAVIVSLVLYAFFAHVAGVAIPQGELVVLP